MFIDTLETNSLWVALIGLAVSVFATRLMIHIGILDQPVGRSAHTSPTPRGGGIGIICGLTASLLLSLWLSDGWQPLLPYWKQITTTVAGVGIIALVKFRDDKHEVSYRTRLIAQVGCSVLMVLTGLTVYFEPGTIWEGLAWLQVALTVICFMFAMNACNFADGLNGLISGSIMMMLPVVYWDLNLNSSLASPLHVFWVQAILWSLFWAILGFFIFNYPKAKIFLGDVGSSFLGFMLGILALLIQDAYLPGYVLPTVHEGPFTLLFPLSFIWFDVIFTILRRAYLKRHLAQPHQEHMFHILYRCGFGHTFISGLYMLFAMTLAGANLLRHYGWWEMETVIVGYCLLQALYVAWVFGLAKQKNIPV